MTPKWWDSLVKIAPALEKIDLRVNIKLLDVKVDNRKTDNRSIDFGGLNSEQQEKLLKTLPKFFSDGHEIIEAEYEKRSKDYPKKLGIGNNRKLIDYFAGKIPGADLYALKASVYIKEAFDAGGDVQPLKREVRYRYGRRGINISNLYTAGYFETWIRPMYENMSNKGDFDRSNFLSAFDIVVEQFPFAIFVSKEMSVAEIKKQIKEKISESQKYGIETLNIHGIGTENTLNITRAIETLKREMALKLDIDSKGALYVVKIDLSGK